MDLVDNVDIDGIQFENGSINLNSNDNSVKAKKTILAPGPPMNFLTILASKSTLTSGNIINLIFLGLYGLYSIEYLRRLI